MIKWIKQHKALLDTLLIIAIVLNIIIWKSSIVLAIFLVIVLFILIIIEEEPKPLTVYKWIEHRYKYYDKKEGRNCGEKFTDLIYYEASRWFNISEKRINTLRYEGMQQYIDKSQKKADKIRKKKRKKAKNY